MWGASDSDGTVTEVSLQLNGTSAGVRRSVPYQFNLGRLAAGTHRLAAQALDNNGEVGVSLEHTLYIVEPPPTNTPPIVRIAGPAKDSVFAAAGTIPVQVEATDPDERDRVTRVEIRAGGAMLEAKTNAPFNFELKLAPGEYSIFARAIDNRFANVDSAPVTFRVTGPPPPRYTVLELGTFGGNNGDGLGINSHN
jgi:hypothetical protein